MGTQIRYNKPPIIERIIGVYRPMRLEDFEAKLPSWVDKIKGDYPIPESFAEWFIDITQKGGIPFLKDPQPKARIIHVFWKKHPKNLKVYGMRLRPDRLVFHLRREQDNPHDFDELFAMMEKWVDRWGEHFGVTDVDGVGLEYVNLLNPQVTPQFVNPQGGIQIGRALEMFAKIPGKYHNLTPPYDCKARLVVEEKMPCVFDFRVRAADEKGQGVIVDFAVSTRAPGKSIDFKTALHEIGHGHEIMLGQFDCFYTTEAKQSFIKDGFSDTNPTHV